MHKLGFIDFQDTSVTLKNVHCSHIFVKQLQNLSMPMCTAGEEVGGGGGANRVMRIDVFPLC
jgi:hypothetical protein